MFDPHSHFQQSEPYQQQQQHYDDYSPRIYILDRSPHYHLISKAIQCRRQRKSSTDSSSCSTFSSFSKTLVQQHTTATSPSTNTADHHTSMAHVQNGLPSPPMDGHFKMTPTSSPSPSHSFTTSSTEEQDSLVDSHHHSSSNGLSKADICVKLQELRDEKHRLFQLIKQQLVQEEQQQQLQYIG
ncbi:hypothetical protein BDA99DRAFT_204012 [Phascolomyces articulosus]|uniref:Uncharacterized protein n=1 Tax=Phascolomyces articulosus TaxID=60185 RepID=A0AAD5JSE8_9FUNG|nr:hypothetical protein BDA99DRAFT_204012 [Phascolomyces articulosus]